MVYYAFSLLLLMLLRPLISIQFVESKGTKSIYAALYFLPILIVLQAVFGGLICKYSSSFKCTKWGIMTTQWLSSVVNN